MTRLIEIRGDRESSASAATETDIPYYSSSTHLWYHCFDNKPSHSCVSKCSTAQSETLRQSHIPSKEFICYCKMLYKVGTRRKRKLEDEGLQSSSLLMDPAAVSFAEQAEKKTARRSASPKSPVGLRCSGSQGHPQGKLELKIQDTITQEVFNYTIFRTSHNSIDVGQAHQPHIMADKRTLRSLRDANNMKGLLSALRRCLDRLHTNGDDQCDHRKVFVLRSDPEASQSRRSWSCELRPEEEPATGETDPYPSLLDLPGNFFHSETDHVIRHMKTDRQCSKPLYFDGLWSLSYAFSTWNIEESIVGNDDKHHPLHTCSSDCNLGSHNQPLFIV